MRGLTRAVLGLLVNVCGLVVHAPHWSARDLLVLPTIDADHRDTSAERAVDSTLKERKLIAGTTTTGVFLMPGVLMPGVLMPGTGKLTFSEFPPDVRAPRRRPPCDLL